MSDRTLKVALVVGARPNFMKAAPILEAMATADSLEPVLIHTGQHYDEALSDLLFRQLGMPEPDHHLGVGSASQTVQTARIMTGLEPLFQELRPGLVMVVGDVNSTVAAALVAASLRIPVAHVEAGLRSFDRRMPEEVNRVVTDRISDILYTTERSGGENLRREGAEEERIVFVGNVMIDTLVKHREAAAALGVPARHGLEPDGYALATLHRPSNVDDPASLEAMVRVLEATADRLPVVFPVHPRTGARLRETRLEARLRDHGRIHALEPLGYLEFLGLMADARLVITDSGGIQEETTVLGVPCLTARENTERPVTVTHGTNRLVGTDPDDILAAVADVLDSPRTPPSSPEGWDGRAAERIVDHLLAWAGGGARGGPAAGVAGGGAARRGAERSGG
jgi:UDP-N-acetylglucosamine 2-epimerase (non-hydrolysing)